MTGRLILSFALIFLFGGLNAQSGAACKCCEAAFRQFDFWVGDWETTANGQLAGTNHIVVMQDSCVIQENWISAGGQYTGTSYNFYDPQEKKWHQTWVDNQGGSLLLTGGLENGSMVMYSGEMTNQAGKPYTNRITWTPNPDGTVRQLWEASTDGGATWKPLFDGLYTRKMSNK